MGQKIIFISHTAEYTGGEASLHTLLKQAGSIDVTPFVVLPQEGPFRQKLTADGIKNYISPYPWWVICKGQVTSAGNCLQQNVQSLVEFIRQEKPDLIHTNTSVVWEGALAAKLTGIPHIWHIHEVLEKNPSLQPILPFSLFYHIIEFLSDRVVTVSNSLRDSLLRYIGPEKLVTIFNGVDEARFVESSGTFLRAEIGSRNDDILVAAVGSLTIEKGQETLLDAAGIAVRCDLPLRFVIVGDGPQEYRASLLQMAQDLGIADRVVFSGYRDDIPSVLEAADLVVVPSLTESFSLVAVEAMASGKAVIATECGGPGEIVVHGKTGYLVPVSDPVTLAERIVELARDSEKRKNMGREGRRRFELEFRAETYAARFADLYREVLEGHQGTGVSERDRLLVQAYMDTYQAVQKSIWQEHVINGLLNSASWRITAPLRKLHERLSRFRTR